MTAAGTHTHEPKVRSHTMLLVQEDLARALILQRLDEAEAVRQARIARARRVRQNHGRVARATSRARLIVAFGSTR